MPRRFCGDSRVSGGVYIEAWVPAQPLTLAPHAGLRAGRRHQMMIDPPIPVNVEEIGLQAVGVKLIQRNGVYHLMDWVGESHYPNVADFIEEASAVGVSRRVPSNLPLNLFTSASRLLLVHPRAWIDGNVSRFGRFAPVCPRTHTSLAAQSHREDEMCARRWWHDLSNGTATGAVARQVVRACPCGHSYTGYAPPQGNIERRPAIFASVPIQQIAVIRDRVSNRHERAERRLRGAGVTFTVVSE